MSETGVSNRPRADIPALDLDAGNLPFEMTSGGLPVADTLLSFAASDCGLIAALRGVNQDKKTRAMRLGLAKGPLAYEGGLYFN